ncbi:MAG: toll/interleukin-1 receptor domain-containing protein [Blastocatellales bacterium]
MLPQEVFLSHSEKDRPFSSILAETVRRHGIPVWYSRTNVVGAQQWHDEIGSALKRCDWFIVVLSPHSVTSKWVKRELLFALNDQKYENRIVPLLYQDCDYDQLSWTLSLLQFVSFKDNHEVGYRDLLRIWGLGYQS